MKLIKLLTTTTGWVIMGIVLVGAGALAFWFAYDKIPERGELITVTGMAQKVTKVTRQKYGMETSAKYEIDFVTSDNQTLPLKVPGGMITERQAGSLSGQQLTVMLRNGDGGDVFGKLGLGENGRDVWELRHGNSTVIAYPAAREAKTQLHAKQATMGSYMLPAGILLLIASSFRLYRRRAST